MTVAELIELLEEQDQDHEVIINNNWPDHDPWPDTPTIVTTFSYDDGVPVVVIGTEDTEE